MHEDFHQGSSAVLLTRIFFDVSACLAAPASLAYVMRVLVSPVDQNSDLPASRTFVRNSHLLVSVESTLIWFLASKKENGCS